ncbi:Nucleoside-diphosphate-sugar epimerase [Methanonatronarchaeum thermophilum]|uniref:Nucleoside-diphosphate-sugar epimerase n=1 Tax=Methanonatronarchaeum thermophilum TaxID=1927129 RepID=A0A1Y3GCS6_9EURY|nr:NAD-dependent epimerase/dehydratase family protein [Methanonatronarchaeum thermophilum]OUJ19262.1 Nucleoside-diphosphate-sugar epimerase [Methanonatronarchaeum thermophilum]
MNILITGHAGFIGTHLTKKLINNGHNVRGLDNYSASKKLNLKQLKEIKGDIKNQKTVEKAAEGCDIIFHLAAQSSVPKSTKNIDEDFQTNTKGTLNILKTAIKKDIEIINTSTSTVYGPTNKTPTPENEPLKPISPYGASKASAEMYCNALHNTHNLNIKTLRLYNVYGPKNKKGVMWDFFNKLTKNPNKLKILGTGKQEKDYIYIKDTIDAFIKTWKNGEPGETYNVGTGKTLTVNQIAKKITDLMNINPKYTYTGGKSWKGDIEKTQADTTKLRQIGWKPQTTANQGIKKTYNWYQKTQNTSQTN